MTDTAPTAAQPFRFFDNREKYLLFVTTCSEKSAVAERIGHELDAITPRPPALRLFDAGMGDATVLTRVMRDLHQRYPTVPFLVVAKEISLEDVRLGLEKLADRLYEHPQTVIVITNMLYAEAPWLKPRGKAALDRLNWWDVPLEGNTAHAFDSQIRDLHNILAEGWQTKTSPKTGNPLYVDPSVLVIYRADQKFALDRVVPQPGATIEADFDLIIASQPYRARQTAALKARNVLVPLSRALGPDGRMVVVQGTGRDPGMEIIHSIWPDENPFQTPGHALISALQTELGDSMPDLRYGDYPDQRSLFRYHLHALPSEVGSNIGTSTLLAAWNAAIYVAQIEDDRLTGALEQSKYLDATAEVLRRHGGLWFLDESFVIRRSSA